MLTNSRDIIRRLEAEGFVLVRIRGSHYRFKHPRSGRAVTVTHPKKDLPLKTVRSIYAQAGWRRD